MIGELVGVIVLAFIPLDSNMLDNLFVAMPMHVHVPCLGLLWIYAGFDKPISSGVVFLERRRMLLVTKTDERRRNSNIIFSIAKSLAFCENRSVALVVWEIRFVTRPITDI